MKRIIPVFVVVLILLSLGSCSKEFSYRGSRFGDSLEQVKKAEGDDGEIGEEGDYQSISYEREIYDGYKGKLTYFFKNDDLKLILGLFSDFKNESKKNIEDIYRDLKQTLINYGNPTKEEALEYSMYQALWDKDGYGIALNIMKNTIFIACSSDPGRVKRFNDTYMFTSFFSETDDTSIKRHVPGPDFYNDPYELSSFIPLPEKGYDYIVRNSIKEEELSVLENSPSMQELISAFGYPPFAEIYKDSVLVNGETEYVKVFYLHYFVHGKIVGFKYDEDCNLIDVDSRNLTGIPEAEYDSNIKQPIGIIRNDISRDELSFIDTDTTPEELQDVLGAPHRECYNDKLFRRVGFDFIRFVMSRYFLYPLKDGGVLEVNYSKGNGNELNVSAADIYEDNGEVTELVGYGS